MQERLALAGPWLGVQRLTLVDPERRDAVLARAVARGVAWFDTADTYGPDLGDAERALAPWAPAARVATKGGLVRGPGGGRWTSDARASHLERSALASRARLGVDRIDLYQLHAPDPRVALSTSIRALDRLRTGGVIGAVGLCNVSATELAAALDLARIDVVQVELSPHRPGAFRSGVIELARDHAVPVLVYRPLGGPDGIVRLRRDVALGRLAADRGVSPEQLVLTWLRDLGLHPIPGPTRPETLDAALDALTGPPLDAAAREALDAAFEPGRLRTPRAVRAARAGVRPGEVVIVMGTPGAGKTTRVAAHADHLRLNRDERGGTLETLVGDLREALAAGVDRVVLDNTYASRASRSPVLEAAWDAGLVARCEWLTTSPDDAEVNVVNRILDALGALPEPEAFDSLNKANPGIVPPRALSRYRSQFEAPSVGEGFTRVDEIPFVRRAPPPGGPNVLLLDPRDLVPDQAATIHERVDQGWIPVVTGWEATTDPAAVLARWAARAQALGLAPELALCPHPAGPPVCWCRKPLPGLALAVLRRLGADPAAAAVLGRLPADRALATKLGARSLHGGV